MPKNKINIQDTNSKYPKQSSIPNIQLPKFLFCNLIIDYCLFLVIWLLVINFVAEAGLEPATPAL